MSVSIEALEAEARGTGFRVEMLEKVVRLMSVLEGVRDHPFLGERLALKAVFSRENLLARARSGEHAGKKWWLRYAAMNVRRHRETEPGPSRVSLPVRRPS